VRLRWTIANAVQKAGMTSPSPAELTVPDGSSLGTGTTKSTPTYSTKSRQLYKGTYGQVKQALQDAGLVTSPCDENGFENGVYTIFLPIAFSDANLCRDSPWCAFRGELERKRQRWCRVDEINPLGINRLQLRSHLTPMSRTRSRLHFYEITDVFIRPRPVSVMPRSSHFAHDVPFMHASPVYSLAHSSVLYFDSVELFSTHTHTHTLTTISRKGLYSITRRSTVSCTIPMLFVFLFFSSLYFTFDFASGYDLPCLGFLELTIPSRY
jgi:hypothetical protein